MTNYKEIIRLHSLGLNKTRIAESCGCARSTVITALHKAEENGLSWNAVKNLSSEEVTRKLYPATSMGQRYSMPDYEWVHKEMQKSGVTLSLLWVEYELFGPIRIHQTESGCTTHRLRCRNLFLRYQSGLPPSAVWPPQSVQYA